MANEIRGLEEVTQAFEEMTTRVQNKVLRYALRKGANLMRDEARALAPNDTGNLKKAIISAASRSSDRNIIMYKVKIKSRPYMKDGVKKDPAVYATPLEMGHLVVGRGKGLKGGKNSKAKQRADMKGSGVKFVPPKPFLRPAFDAKNEAAFEAVVEEFKNKIGELIEP